MRAAIIGAGFISDYHADGYTQAENTELVAVCDVDIEQAEKLAQRYGCKAYADAETMLEAEKPDAVSVCVPSFLHEQYVLLALTHGAHVLCEKPLALTLEACHRMNEAAEKRGLLLMTGQVLHWWPEYQTISEQISRMGRPAFLSTQRLQHGRPASWVNDPQKGGGALFDLFVHDVDFACSLSDDAPEIQAVWGQKGGRGAWRRLCVMLQWPDGMGAKIEAANMMPFNFPFTVAFRADYADACIDYRFKAPLNIQRDAKTEASLLVFEHGEVQALPTHPNAQTEAFRREIAAFTRGITAHQNPFPCLKTIAMMETIQRVKEMLERDNKPQ